MWIAGHLTVVEGRLHKCCMARRIPLSIGSRVRLGQRADERQIGLSAV